MGSAIDEFRSRLASEWLPSFCAAREQNGFGPGGFRWETAARLTEFDAHWFLVAVDAGLVTEEGGFFTAPMSKANEQLFWVRIETESPRTFTLWTEPIITIGALGRLNAEFLWPADRLGCQSKGFGLDLACYDHSERMLVDGEVKKAKREVAALLKNMHRYADGPTLPAPAKGLQRHAFKKVVSIRNNRPSLFWTVVPEGHSQLFEVIWLDKDGAFALEATQERRLTYDGPA